MEGRSDLGMIGRRGRGGVFRRGGGFDYEEMRVGEDEWLEVM